MPPTLATTIEGSGPGILLLHSSGLSSRQFRRLSLSLAERGFRTIAPDLSGHGRSPAIAEPEPFSFEADVAWVVDALSREPAHVIGHSYGAFVALQAARRVPEHVLSMALFEPVAFGVLDPIAHRAACDELAAADFRWGSGPDERERWLRSFVEYWGGVGAWDAQREDARAEFRRVAWAVREGVRSLMADRTRASAYAAIRAPITLVSGEKSTVAARTVVRVLGDTLPNARVITVPGAGHMAPLTHADAVNAIFTDAVIGASSAGSG